MTALMPSPERSKQPTSSTGPKRFFTARTIRSRVARSPSNCSTTSTRCSSTRGPAMPPSLVTWPTSTVAIPRLLACRTSAAVTSLTWVTPPGTPVDALGADRLHRVDDQQVGLELLDVGEHGAEVGLGGEVEVVVDARGSGRPAAAPGPRTPRRRRRACGCRCARSGRPPRAAASTCRRRARRPAAPRRPGTSPPPSTRSSSGTPQDRDRDSSIGTWPIGTAAEVTGAGWVRRSRRAAAAATSTRLPQAWHSPQRPTHFGGLPAALGAPVRGAGCGGCFGSWTGTLGDGADRTVGSARAARGRLAG